MKKETGRPEGYRSAGNNKEANQMTSMERRDVEDEMLYQFSQVSTKEQYQKAVDAFNSMDDAQFEEFYTRYMEKAEKVTTWKEYHARVEEMRRANGVTEHNSALNSVYARFLDEEGNRELWSKINETNPSDRVTLTFDDIKQLNRLWHERTPAADAGTPADILISGSIPLTDMELSIKGKDSPIDTYRIVIFKNYQQIITENKEARVGALIIYLGPRQIACPLFVMHGINGINFVDDIGHIGLTEKMIREKKIAVNALLKMAGFVMNAWYGVMIALLHPVVKDVFRKGAKQKVKTASIDDKGNRKRIVRYVKQRYIGTEKLIDAITGGGRSRTYHALVWHVVGHWRRLPSGERTFVKPYWKGAMRNLKKNLDEVERQLVLPKEE